MDDAVRRERFELAYRALYEPICGYVFRRVSTAEDAAEVVAETFLILWRRLEEAPHGETLRPWVYGVARRTIANHVRGERRRSALADRLLSEFMFVAERRRDPAEHVTERDQLRTAFARLNDGDRELLGLVAWEGLTHEQIAVALGVSRAVVRLRLHRARRRLASHLDGNDAQRTGGAGQVSNRRATTRSGVAEGAPR